MSSLDIYYDKDCDLSLIKKKKVAVLGYGSQGRAHALNLKDSGVDVVVGLRPESSTNKKVKADGLPVKATADAVEGADVVMVLTPDELQAKIYREDIEPNLKEGAALAFGHGFAIHYGQIAPRRDLDVIMIAPKAPGHTVRNEFTNGRGIPDLIAVAQDANGGHALELAKSYASAIGGGRTAILIYEGGIANMNYSISNNAEYGEYVTGEAVINDSSREAMRTALKNIQNGDYAKSFIQEGALGYPSMTARRRNTEKHSIEVVGEKLRGMMPWIAANKIIDKDKN